MADESRAGVSIGDTSGAAPQIDVVVGVNMLPPGPLTLTIMPDGACAVVLPEWVGSVRVEVRVGAGKA